VRVLFEPCVLPPGTSLEQVETWHWRIVVSPDDADRFVLNDRGFSYVGQRDRPGRAIFVPLAPRLAALGFIGRRAGFVSELTMTPMCVSWMNNLTWSEALGRRKPILMTPRCCSHLTIPTASRLIR
jgi:hypothetical protein